MVASTFARVVLRAFHSADVARLRDRGRREQPEPVRLAAGCQPGNGSRRLRVNPRRPGAVRRAADPGRQRLGRARCAAGGERGAPSRRQGGAVEGQASHCPRGSRVRPARRRPGRDRHARGRLSVHARAAPVRAAQPVGALRTGRCGSIRRVSGSPLCGYRGGGRAFATAGWTSRCLWSGSSSARSSSSWRPSSDWTPGEPCGWRSGRTLRRGVRLRRRAAGFVANYSFAVGPCSWLLRAGRQRRRRSEWR